MKGLTGLLVSIAVTVALLAYALWGANLGALWTALIEGETWVILPFLVLLTIFFIINAIRWVLILKPFGDYGIRQVAPAMMIGFAGNNLLPLRLGEIVRTLVFARDSGQSRSGILMTLVVERALDLLGILAVFALGLGLVGEVPTVLRVGLWLAVLGVAALVMLMILFARFPGHVLGGWQKITGWLPAAIGERGSVYLRELSRGLQVFAHTKDGLIALLYSLLRWLVTAGMVWLCMRAYGVSLTPGLAMTVVGVTAIAVSLPSVPGFVGPIQAGFVAALSPFGVSQEVALAGSILFLVGHWIPITLVGALFFVTRHQSYRQLRRDMSAMQDA